MVKTNDDDSMRSVASSKKRRLSPHAVASVVVVRATATATVTATGTTTETKKKKTVTFCLTVIEHNENWRTTQAEVLSSWYSKEELEMFKKEQKDFVKALKQVNWNLALLDTCEYCVRGYEAYFSIGVHKKLKNKRALVTKSVLMEQQRQRNMHIRDAELIKMVSSKVTRWAKDRAISFGKKYTQNIYII